MHMKRNPLDMGARIVRFARESHRLSQAELSKRSGVSQSLISRYERGVVEPSLATVQRLLNAAGAVMTIDVDQVRMIDTTRMPTAEETEGIEQAFARMLEKLPKNQQPSVTAARRRWAKPARRRGEAPYAFPQYRRDPPGS